jgi:hypothetical protein
MTDSFLQVQLGTHFVNDLMAELEGVSGREADVNFSETELELNTNNAFRPVGIPSSCTASYSFPCFILLS